MKKSIALLILFSLIMSPFIANAAIIDYRIIVRTHDSNGTDNRIFAKFKGSNGQWSRQFELQGNHERGDVDSFTLQHEDIGIATQIKLDVKGQLADKWGVDYIRVLRATNNDDLRSADGYSEFNIDKESLSYDWETFSPTHTVKPQVTVSPSGEMQMHQDQLTLVQFAQNPHPSADQVVMNFKETWSSVETVSVSSERSESISAHVTVTYESPQTAAGTFGGEAGTAWDNVFTSAKSESRENLTQSEFDWSFLAPAGSGCFRLIQFRVPYADQVYKSSDGKEARIVRKVGGQIVPTGFESFKYIPTRDEEGKIIPIPLSEIENTYLAKMDPGAAEAVRKQHLNNWLSNGWVYAGQERPQAPSPRSLPPTQQVIQAKPVQQQTVIPASEYVRFNNRWITDQYLHVEKGQLESGPIEMGWWSAMWTIEPVEGSEFVRIKNRWTGHYIHAQNLKPEAGEIQPGWWSAMWIIEKVESTQYVRIKNRWVENQYLHVEKGTLELGPIEMGWWSAMWQLN